MTKTKAPPKHLTPDARRLWKRIAVGWQMDDAGFALLQVACEAWGEMELAQANLRENGPVIESKTGIQKANPAINMLKNARSGFLAAWRALQLDVDPPGPPGRPGGWDAR